MMTAPSSRSKLSLLFLKFSRVTPVPYRALPLWAFRTKKDLSGKASDFPKMNRSSQRVIRCQATVTSCGANAREPVPFYGFTVLTYNFKI